MKKFLVLFITIAYALLFASCIVSYARADDMTFNSCTNTVVKIKITKSEGEMQLLNNCDDAIKTYKVRLGLNKGAKQCDGDMKTPEGTYKIIEKRNSKYVKFLALDYPRKKDIERARDIGCKPGDSIGIHAWIKGLPKEGSQGCITVWTKEEILEINKLVKTGTTVVIRP